MSEEEEVKRILEEAKDQIKLENRTGVFEEGRKLKSEDLKVPQDPEEFTKRHVIEKILQKLGISYEAGEMRFAHLTGTRKVDYAPRSNKTSFLLEAKPINSDLYDASKDGAVNQIKGLFLLDEVKKRYGFGVATDGLEWIIINPRREVIAELSLDGDFKRIRDFLTGKREAKKERRQEEISKRFYEWYNALLHGGSFRDLKGRQRSISEDDCLVNNVQTVSSVEDREEIAQIIIDRLIFIKFLQAKGLIKSDVLEYLASLSQTALNWKLNNLFFNVLNTEKKRRSDVDPKFADIPYLNGSLFTKTKPEERNQYYTVKAEILRRVIEFLDSFRFVSESEVEGGEEALDPEILGYIFERAMTATDRKGTGAYYTPKYITRYISENTIYPLLLDRINQFLREEKGYRETELLNSIDELYTKISDTTLADINIKILPKITVCDPACGSGAFLLAAADVLFEIHRNIRDKMGTRSFDVALKKIILQNNIFGVDINHKGIEIAKLRLWLWLAGSYDPEKKIEPLPNIEYNLRAGNSLVGFVDVSMFKEVRVSMDDYLRPEESLVELMNRRDLLIDEYKSASGERARKLRQEIEELNKKIKTRLDANLFNELKAKVGITPEEFAKLDVFHWGFEFHDIFSNDGDGNGFDIIITNPPYVDSELMVKKMKKERELLAKSYGVAKGNWDLYIPFFERVYNITQLKGFISFITPNKWLSIGYGRHLRGLLRHHIFRLCGCDKIKVFEEAGNSPVISFIKRGEDIPTVITVEDFKENFSLGDEYYVPRLTIERDNWGLLLSPYLDLLLKIQSDKRALSDYCDVENPFTVSEAYELKNHLYDGINENNFDLKFINTGTIDKYITLWGKKNTTYIKEKYIQPFVNKNTFKKAMPRRFEQSSSKKIIITGMRYFECFLDLDGTYVAGKSTIILRNPVKGCSLEALIGILNSTLMSFFVKEAYGALGIEGGINFTSKMVATLPIPEFHDESLAGLTRDIIDLTSQPDFFKSIEKQTQIEKLKEEIDQIVYKLYGLTEEEINIVKGD